MVTRYETARATAFRAELRRRRLGRPRHQISRAFSDGCVGHGLVGSLACAIVVGDFVEFLGPFDGELFDALREIDEVHLLEPAPAWMTAISSAAVAGAARGSGGRADNQGCRMREYSRTAFLPMLPHSSIRRRRRAGRAGISASADGHAAASALGSPARIPQDLALADGGTVHISPITRMDATELLAEGWAAETVSNTMSSNGIVEPGFGFVARAGRGGGGPGDGRIVGAVGCYALYRHGAEIEIDVHHDFRRNGIATALARLMIEECSVRSLACHWDAANAPSAALARKLGFVPERTYPCVEVTWGG